MKSTLEPATILSREGQLATGQVDRLARVDVLSDVPPVGQPEEGQYEVPHATLRRKVKQFLAELRRIAKEADSSLGVDSESEGNVLAFIDDARDVAALLALGKVPERQHNGMPPDLQFNGNWPRVWLRRELDVLRNWATGLLESGAAIRKPGRPPEEWRDRVLAALFDTKKTRFTSDEAIAEWWKNMIDPHGPGAASLVRSVQKYRQKQGGK